MNSQLIIFGLIFVGIILIVEGIYLVVFGKSIKLNSRVNRRLALLEQGKAHEEVMETLRKEREQHMGGIGIPIYSILKKKASQANIAFTPNTLIILMVGLTAVAFCAMTILTETKMSTSFPISIAIGVGGVYAWLNSKAKKRMALFEEQLPDAIDLIVRSLKVGRPFSNAINVVAEEMPDPIGSEFGLIADEAAYGMDLSKALENMTDRIDVQDLRFLTVAVSIQLQSGGNLSEVLAGLSKVIRERFKLFRRVKAITAEAKWSGYFLSAFPLGALAAVKILDPHFFDAVRLTPYYTPAAIVVGIMLTVNVLVMKALVNIKV